MGSESAKPLRGLELRRGSQRLGSGPVGSREPIATHDVSLNLTKPIPVGSVDIEVPVRRNGRAFGKAKISKGAIDWMRRTRAKPSTTSIGPTSPRSWPSTGVGCSCRFSRTSSRPPVRPHTAGCDHPVVAKPVAPRLRRLPRNAIVRDIRGSAPVGSQQRRRDARRKPRGGLAGDDGCGRRDEPAPCRFLGDGA